MDGKGLEGSPHHRLRRALPWGRAHDCLGGGLLRPRVCPRGWQQNQPQEVPANAGLRWARLALESRVVAGTGRRIKERSFRLLLQGHRRTQRRNPSVLGSPSPRKAEHCVNQQRRHVYRAQLRCRAEGNESWICSGCWRFATPTIK